MHDPLKHSRHAVRWAVCDYAGDGAYFVTLCTVGKVCLFGDAAGEGIHLNEYGKIVQACWKALPKHYVDLKLDAFVVMPNHLHGIIVLGDVGPGPRHTENIYDDPVGAGLQPAQVPTDTQGRVANPPLRDDKESRVKRRHGVSEIVRGFKTFSAKRINALRGTQGKSLWQRSFHDRVIRDEDEWRHIYEYIEDNPARWAADRENSSVKIRKGEKNFPWL